MDYEILMRNNKRVLRDKGTKRITLTDELDKISDKNTDKDNYDVVVCKLNETDEKVIVIKSILVKKK